MPRTGTRSRPGWLLTKPLLTTIEAINAGGDREALLKPWTGFGRHVFGAGEHNDVNMICWFGKDFAAWNGHCPPQVYEEKWICLMMPCKHGSRIHEACGSALCSHYASVIQWHEIDKDRRILERYRKARASITDRAAAITAGSCREFHFAERCGKLIPVRTRRSTTAQGGPHERHDVSSPLHVCLGGADWYQDDRAPPPAGAHSAAGLVICLSAVGSLVRPATAVIGWAMPYKPVITAT